MGVEDQFAYFINIIRIFSKRKLFITKLKIARYAVLSSSIPCLIRGSHMSLGNK